MKACYSLRKRCSLVFYVAVVLLACLNCFESFAETTVTGLVQENTTWTLAGSPYIAAVRGAMVEENVTLTIEPGVIVKIGVDRMFQVNGTLIARGTQDNPITFTSDQEDPQPGDWKYIEFTDSSSAAALDAARNYTDGSILQYCVIKYGGIRVVSAAPFIDHCTIRYYADTAIHIDSSPTDTDIVISNNVISDSVITDSGDIYGAIYVRDSGAIIINSNTISGITVSDANNDVYGGGIAVLRSNTATVSGNIISDCSFSGSYLDVRGGGIYADYNSSIIINNNTISGITVSDSNSVYGAGIYTSSNSSVTINDNKISDITVSDASTVNGGGIYVRDNSSITINGNTISGITISDARSVYGGGIHVNDSAATISDNVISDNSFSGNYLKVWGGGIYVSGDSSTISGNRIANNLGSSSGSSSSYSVHGIAIYIINSTDSTVTSNVITGNKATAKSGTTSSIYADSSILLNLNDIYGNETDYELYYSASQGSPVLDATNNYWGTTDALEVFSRIYDRFTDPTKAIVEFEPLSESPYGAPASPENLSITTSADSVTLNWSASPESNVAGYRVYYDTDSGATYQGAGATQGDSPIDAGNVTSFSLTGLQPNTVYYFTVAAYTTDDLDGAAAAEVSNNSPPAKPSNQSPSNDARGISLTPTLAAPFSDPDAADSHKASQWQITIIPGDYSNLVYDSGVDTKNLTSIVASELEYSIRYYWRVRQQDSKGVWSGYSDEISFVTVSDGDPGSYEASYQLTLSSGLHMISLPLQPDVPFTARSFGEKLGATFVIQYDEDKEEFLAFVPAIDATDGFSINGGFGYIVKLAEATTVMFTGRAWSNTAPPRPTERACWAFIIGGMVTASENDTFQRPLTVIVANQNTGEYTTAAVDSAGPGRYAAALLNMARTDVIRSQDVIQVTVQDAYGETVAGPYQQMVTAQDIQKGVLLLHPRLGEFIPMNNWLGQNYPNPFNPETWIPFQIAGDSDVVIRIYGGVGQLVRVLNLGHRAAGFYTSRERAAYWDGKNRSGEDVSSGTYFYSITAGDLRNVRKLTILR